MYSRNSLASHSTQHCIECNRAYCSNSYSQLGIAASHGTALAMSKRRLARSCAPAVSAVYSSKPDGALPASRSDSTDSWRRRRTSRLSSMNNTRLDRLAHDRQVGTHTGFVDRSVTLD
ncbi:Uncharacterised protein [Mycobacteroides abscessus subsp. abscessus]|nr:Uncharacterised protein [Mycobacteroides abscessus subsp. abscessus]